MSYVTLDIQDGIATVEFFTEQSNSLPGEILSKLASTIDEAGKDASARVIVLKSGGDRAFCAGASFDELLAIDNEREGRSFFMGFANVINAMRKAPKFIVGRVQGKTVGGGVGLASACDYCMATKHAAIKLSELAVGIGPFVVGPAVQRKVGVSGFSQLAINASEFQSPQWAQEKGLFYDVLEDVQALDQQVQVLSEKLAASNPEAMAEMKAVFWRGTEDWDELLAERAAVSGKLVLSDFTKKFINRFKNG